MANATNSITIDRPVAEVYQFLADGLNNPKWRSAVIGISLASGSVGAVGAIYKQTLKGPFGSKVDGDYRITKATTNSRIEFEVITGPARPLGTFENRSSQQRSQGAFLAELSTGGIHAADERLDPKNHGRRGTQSFGAEAGPGGQIAQEFGAGTGGHMDLGENCVAPPRGLTPW